MNKNYLHLVIETVVIALVLIGLVVALDIGQSRSTCPAGTQRVGLDSYCRPVAPAVPS